MITGHPCRLHDFVYVVVTIWLSVHRVEGNVVLVSDVIEPYSDQVLASDVYATLAPSSDPITIQAWINIASERFAPKRQLFCVQSSTTPATVTPSLHIVNSSYVAVEVTTTESGGRNTTESQIFPYMLTFDEWIFVEVVIRPGIDRSISTTLAYPDGSILTITQRLKGDMIRSEAFDVIFGSTRHSNAPAAHAFLAYLAIDQYSSRGKMEVIQWPPNQVYSEPMAIGGQIFQQSYSTLSLACSQPGSIMTSIDFASFGRPYGVFPNFRINWNCHSNRTLETVRVACLGRNRCSIVPDDVLFGDPCPGQRKNIAIVAKCNAEPTLKVEGAAVQATLMDSVTNLPQMELLDAMNVSIQILFDSTKSSLSTALTTFISVFDAEFNTTSDRIFNPNIRPLRYPLMVFTFTIMPPTTLYDLVSARYLAQAFTRYMQTATSELRKQTLLSGAPQPPVAVGVVEVKIRLCNNRYVYVQSTEDPCTDAKQADNDIITSLGQITLTVIIMLCVGVAASVIIALIVLSKNTKRHAVESDDNSMKPGPSTMSMTSVRPAKQVDAMSPSNFSVAKSETTDRTKTQTKLSIRNFPMRIDRLAAIGQTKSFQATDSETDSAFMSDYNHLSVESGPARVVEYFTDSS